MTGCGTYYMTVEEWNYPTESGRDAGETFDTEEEALAWCRTKAESEEENFEAVCRTDALPAWHTLPFGGDCGGYIVSAKNGLDPFFYYCRAFRIESL